MYLDIRRRELCVVVIGSSEKNGLNQKMALEARDAAWNIRVVGLYFPSQLEKQNWLDLS